MTAVSQVVSSAKRGESVAAVLPVSSRTALARESHDVPETVHQAPWLKQALHPPAPELDRLTDHVIRQIDSRMIAWRERMGKI